jgi:hypothetical protein
MNQGLIVVTEAFISEVLAAVNTVRRPSSVYVTRREVEGEISANPGRYPLLRDASRTFLRQIITKVMKRQFSVWGESTGKKRCKMVWDVTRPAGVIT